MWTTTARMKTISIGMILAALVGCKEPAAPSKTETPPTPKTVEAPAARPTCDAGDVDACLALAKSVLPAQPGPNGYEAAAIAKTVGPATKACELKSAEGCALLGSLLRYGSAEQRAALETGCELGWMPACGSLGTQLADPVSNTREDVAKGVALLERACAAKLESGHFCEQASLAYAVGEKISKNQAKSKELHARACEQGLLQGCACSTDEQCGDNTGLVCERGTCVTAEVQ